MTIIEIGKLSPNARTVLDRALSGDATFMNFRIEEDSGSVMLVTNSAGTLADVAGFALQKMAEFAPGAMSSLGGSSKSTAKAIAARRNGGAPVKPGNRARGRPPLKRRT